MSGALHILGYLPSSGFKELKEIEQAKAALAGGGTLWVDIEGRSPESDAILGEVFGFHPLAIEDVYKERHRPKVEDYDEYLYIIVRGLRDASELGDVVTTELDVFLGRNFVVTHHDGAVPSVTAARDEVRRTLGSALTKGAVYMAHRLLDRLVDEFRDLPDVYMREVDRLEAAVLGGHDELARILELKGALHRIRRTAQAQTGVLARLARAEFDEIPQEARPFFRDVHEHMAQVAERLDTEHSELQAVFDAFHSLSAHRMNEIMKVLTLISTIMLPLTFLAGVYGMNFDNMPELHWKYGYFIVWGVMITLSTGMVFYFRRRGWL